MHYINGRRAQEGDFVVAMPSHEGAKPVAGKLHSVNAGAQTCNGQISVPTLGGFSNHYVSLGTQCLHVEDLLAVAGPDYDNIPIIGTPEQTAARA